MNVLCTIRPMFPKVQGVRGLKLSQEGTASICMDACVAPTKAVAGANRGGGGGGAVAWLPNCSRDAFVASSTAAAPSPGGAPPLIAPRRAASPPKAPAALLPSSVGGQGMARRRPAPNNVGNAFEFAEHGDGVGGKAVLVLLCGKPPPL